MKENVRQVTGSVQPKGKSWRAVLSVMDFEEGRRKPKWVTIGPITRKRGDGGLTKTQAKLKLQDIIHEYNEKQKRDSEKFKEYQGMSSVERNIHKAKKTDFYEYIINYIETNKSRLQFKTYQSYSSLTNSRIKDFFYKKYKVEDIDYFVLESFFKTIDMDGLKRSTKTRYKAVLNLAINDAVNKDVMAKNPLLKFPKGTFGGTDFKAETYSMKDAEMFVNAVINDEDTIGKLIAITFLYALRKGEVLGWKWSQINFEEKTVSLETEILSVPRNRNKDEMKRNFNTINKIYSTKGRSHIVEQNTMKTKGSSVVMPLLDSVIDALKKIKEETEKNKEFFGNCYDHRFEEFVFVRPDGYIITPRNATLEFKKLAQKYGMKEIRFHDIRHTTAKLLLKEGWSMKHIQRWLRHSDMQTTAKFYADTDEEELLKVAEDIDKMYNISEKSEGEE